MRQRHIEKLITKYHAANPKLSSFSNTVKFLNSKEKMESEVSSIWNYALLFLVPRILSASTAAMITTMTTTTTTP